ncbi:MAG: hypothetical protein GF384_03475 [Elusimicrobia bacterium]|nr:hypothetical protein [Elusimicrobiota bacterium]MBD3411974.1 hypothetical protein [Elusimicrobiota bacterium]
MKFDKEYFKQQSFSDVELNNLKAAIIKTLHIASSNSEPEIIFHFAYMALLKIGIYYIAKEGYRIKSKPGHHIKIIDTLSTLMKNDDIAIIGNNMRKNRNLDIYSISVIITHGNAQEYLSFVQNIFNKISD